MPPGKEKRTRGGTGARKAVPEHTRSLLVEALAEFKAHSGISDAESHKRDHDMFREFAPLLSDFRTLLRDIKDDVIPYVKEQRQVIIDKRIDNREVYRTIKIWALKLLVGLVLLSLFYGGLKAGVEHLPLLGGG